MREGLAPTTWSTMTMSSSPLAPACPASCPATVDVLEVAGWGGWGTVGVEAGAGAGGTWRRRRGGALGGGDLGRGWTCAVAL